jgi:hypothetical protein
MKNVIFIPAYNGHAESLKYCIESWKWYANKYNIDIVVGDETLNSDFETWGNGCWQKYKELTILNGDWDKILMIDADTMIRWDAPNVF